MGAAVTPIRESSMVAGTKNEEDKLRKVCEQFEAVFLKQLVKSMWKTVPGGGPLGKGFANEVYTDMVNDILAGVLAKKGFGIADILYRQLSQKASQE